MNGDKQTLSTQSLQSIYTLDIRMKIRGNLSNTQPIWLSILFAWKYYVLNIIDVHNYIYQSDCIRSDESFL